MKRSQVIYPDVTHGCSVHASCRSTERRIIPNEQGELFTACFAAFMEDQDEHTQHYRPTLGKREYEKQRHYPDDKIGTFERVFVTAWGTKRPKPHTLSLTMYYEGHRGQWEKVGAFIAVDGKPVTPMVHGIGVDSPHDTAGAIFEVLMWLANEDGYAFDYGGADKWEGSHLQELAYSYAQRAYDIWRNQNKKG